MHPARFALAGGAIAGGISLVLDYVTADLTGDVAGWEATAWPAVVLLVGAAVAGMVGDRREGLPAAGTVLVVALGAAALLFAVAKLVDAAAAVDIIRDASGSAAIGAGAWLLPAAALVSLGGGVASASRRVV
jgi:hypothetical protein